MSTNEAALAEKAKGNKFFSDGAFADAITHYSAAIELDPTDAVFFSNRSACHASLHQYSEAVADAGTSILCGLRCVGPVSARRPWFTRGCGGRSCMRRWR